MKKKGRLDKRIKRIKEWTLRLEKKLHLQKCKEQGILDISEASVAQKMVGETAKEAARGQIM